MKRIYTILKAVNNDKKIVFTVKHKTNIILLIPKIIYLSKKLIITYEFDTEKLNWKVKHKKLSLINKEKSLFYLIMST
jgi:ABC-type Mn2+/Zn2+ transport system ATPase subunit